MSEKLRKFVHVRADGNQIFYKGHKLVTAEASEGEKGFIVEIIRLNDDYDDVTVAVVRLAESESVGEYFSPLEEETKEKK